MNKKISAISRVFFLTALVFTMFVQTVNGDDPTNLIHGRVGEIVKIDNGKYEPILKLPWLGSPPEETKIEYRSGVRVYVILQDENYALTSKCAFTDENGEYSISVPVGVYSVNTDKKGYETSIIDEVNVTAEVSTQLDIAIYEGEQDDSKFFPLGIEEYRQQIEENVKASIIGCEFTLENISKEVDYKKIIVLYDDLSIDPINITKGNVSFLIDGEEIIGGRTIVLHMEKGILDFNENLTINYDETPIRMADNLEDIFNPDDDGSHPEYYLVNAKNGLQMMISVPHFSEHTISIYSLTEEEIVEEIVEEFVEEIKRYPEFAAFAALAVIIVATIVMIRKGKEED